ncbi:hypothetical protein B4U80_13707 [Leptotrombidium deliense]|uniref:Kazal-like domain-containing protein n=1 Tax=Leptotrombidium deliense TaxID=299467 RepID=A0A443SJG5_9ACAR|nr:hypothetical protein B4U80_13707 [Leptotrombidium deliense]
MVSLQAFKCVAFHLRKCISLFEGLVNDPCEGFLCESEFQVCQVDDYRHANCNCNYLKCLNGLTDEQKIANVCGTDGLTYANQCELESKACTEKIKLKVHSQRECVAGTVNSQ